MGLDMSVPDGDTSYSYSYSRLHLIRWEAYRSIGGKADWLNFNHQQRDERYDIKFIEAFDKFKNLFNHSDCEGTYTLKGKPGKDESLTTGNLPVLKKELTSLKTHFKKESTNEVAKPAFRDFLTCVNEAIKLKTKVCFG